MNEQGRLPTGVALSLCSKLTTPNSKLLLKEAPVGIEPTVADLQSAALPLGDGAELCTRNTNRTGDRAKHGNVSTTRQYW